MRDENEFQYDVAISFAGEDRATVATVAECLAGRGVRVFYDDFERTSLWGKDLQEHLTSVYLRWSRYAIIFISTHYGERIWTRLELKAALARAMVQRASISFLSESMTHCWMACFRR